MGVGDSRHGVDLEVLVRSVDSNSLDRSPVGEGRLSIVEPFVSQSLHVVSIDVRDSLSNLRSGDSASSLDHLLSNFSVDLVVRLEVHQLIVEVVSATDDFDIVDVVTIDGWQANTAVVHLSGENLVTEEVVSEDTTIRVGEVVRVSSGHIWKISEHGVHRVVLLVHIIEMSSILINSVRAEQVLEKQEGVVVLMFLTRSIVEDTNI